MNRSTSTAEPTTDGTSGFTTDSTAGSITNGTAGVVVVVVASPRSVQVHGVACPVNTVRHLLSLIHLAKGKVIVDAVNPLAIHTHAHIALDPLQKNANGTYSYTGSM